MKWLTSISLIIILIIGCKVSQSTGSVINLVTIKSDSISTGFVHILTTDSITNKPLVGSTVTLANEKSGYFTMGTGLNGICLFMVPVGEYTLYCSNVGYYSVRLRNVVVYKDNVTKVNIGMNITAQILIR